MPQRDMHRNSSHQVSLSPTVHGWLLLSHEHRSAAAAAARTAAAAAAAAAAVTSCG